MDNLVAITAVVGSCSIVSSLIICVTYFWFPQLRTDWRRLLVYLSICDCMQGMFYCLWSLVPASKSITCYGFSMFGLYSANAAYLWTACIAHMLHRRMTFMVGNHDIDNRDVWFWFYHGLCWGYPALIIVICLAFDSFWPCEGSDCFGCFLVPVAAWRIFGLYATLWACWIFTLGMYVRTFINFKRLVHGMEITTQVKEFSRTFQLKLLLVPLLFIVLRLPETLYRIREIVFGAPVEDAFEHVLNQLQAFCNPAQGLTNFILFVVATPLALKSCQNLWFCIFPCCPRKIDEQTSLLDPIPRPAFGGQSTVTFEGQSTFRDLSPKGDIYLYSHDNS